MANGKGTTQSAPTAQAQQSAQAQSGTTQQSGEAGGSRRQAGRSGRTQTMQIMMAQVPGTDMSPRLRQKAPVSVAFPPCTDELLALIRSADGDDCTKAFRNYFKFGRHVIFNEGSEPAQQLASVIDPVLLTCPDNPPGTILAARPRWPTECCLCSPCVKIDGDRNLPVPAPVPVPDPGIRRLFLGDVAWLFFYERMGIHQILGAILDAFATTGRLPISNGSLESSTISDDVVAIVLEVMVRQTKMGLSSGVRDRGALYRTALGWESSAARGLNLDTEVNGGLNSLFHRFIYNSLEFYRDKRLAIAIQGASAAPKPSAATLVTIRDTIDLLKKRFEMFDYGRNYYNTLAGIVWTIAGMSVVRALRSTLGIPSAAFDQPYEYIPAAYDLLVLKRPYSRAEMNRYDLHKTCATMARDILLDIEVLDYSSVQLGSELDNWLNNIEGKVEAYRTAYRHLTGNDLGTSGAPAVEQQVQPVA